MNDSLIGKARRRDDSDEDPGQEYCSVCREPLPPGATFCPHCGPPNPPEEEPDEGMGKGQTLFRILLIVLLFGALAVFKLDLNPEAWFKDPSSTPAGLKSRVHKGTPQDVDFKTIHRVKITRAKVRRDPSAKAPVLLVLKKDTRVNILEGNEDWWKITVKGKTGWVSKTDLDSEIR